MVHQGISFDNELKHMLSFLFLLFIGGYALSTPA